MIIQPSLRIKFLEEKQVYTVVAANERFTICTKPFNAQKTVIYTVIDWKKNMRGPENLIFGAGAETKKDCREMLFRLSSGESMVSPRYWIRLKIEAIKVKK